MKNAITSSSNVLFDPVKDEASKSSRLRSWNQRITFIFDYKTTNHLFIIKMYNLINVTEWEQNLVETLEPDEVVTPVQ